MIRSMTAFARQDLQQSWGMLSCEIRTVNHRYLEPQFRLPDVLRELENDLREALRTRLRRGKVDVGMRLQMNDATGGALAINFDLARDLNEAINQINRMLDNPAHINAMDVLRWPGVMAVQEQDMGAVKAAAKQLFLDALTELEQGRAREGERLMPLFDERLARILEIVAEVRTRLPELLERQRQQLQNRFAEARVELEPERLAQEMVMLAQKADVAEELDRLAAHVAEVRQALQDADGVGRRLDFLMQELNREANTLSSKSIDAGLTKAAVELKVLIEQMREQVQNIE